MNVMKHLTFFLVFTTMLSCSAKERTLITKKKAPSASSQPHINGIDKLVLSEVEWKTKLNDEQFQILRKRGTERAFTGKYNAFKGDGLYVCAGCGNPLFDSKTKFDSGTGWPSYTKPVSEKRVLRVIDQSYGMSRIEVKCSRCDGHLGHIFKDGPAPTGERWCINSASMEFRARENLDGDEDSH